MEIDERSNLEHHVKKLSHWHLQMCMLAFLIKAEFVDTTKCYKVK